MSKCVLDASAILALLNLEPGAELIEPVLPSSAMSTVNVAEVIAELDKRLDISPEESKEMVHTMINQIIPLDFNQAVEIGRLRRCTQEFGLSLGDRACISLALSTGWPIYTTDKIWSKLKLNCQIIVIR
ncbi:type II toxin-antitoxin system VapC family toxin [Candidatus Tisiphia endosymbiont of Nemotelus uliginosus]|uniref:type II toxin-antitoxin system VapC family toxin n=1 Tax=Candidatus Tisiphia endosymbiont of Nemotelus uliginosus TaxID=3077926 RepID=UPI0035C91B55